MVSCEHVLLTSTSTKTRRMFCADWPIPKITKPSPLFLHLVFSHTPLLRVLVETQVFPKSKRGCKIGTRGSLDGRPGQTVLSQEPDQLARLQMLLSKIQREESLSGGRATRLPGLARGSKLQTLGEVA